MRGFFDSLWPLVPAAGALGASLILATLAAFARRHARERRHAGEVEQLRGRLQELLAAANNGNPAAASELSAPLPLVRDASAALTVAEQEQLRQRLIEAGAALRVEGRAARSRRRWRRAAELELLGWLHSESSIAILANELAGRDRDLAYVAGQALAAYDSADAYGVLTDALAAERLPRSRIATLLEGARYRGAAVALERLASHPDPAVRFWVAYLLGRTGDASRHAALEQLAGDHDPNVRANAVEALGELGCGDMAAALLSDPDWVVRSHAARAAAAADRTDVGPQLAKLLTDRFWWVRQNAARALVRLGPTAVAHVLPMLHSDDRFARNKAAEVLVTLGYVDDEVAMVASGSPGDPDRARTVLIDFAGADASDSVRARLAQVDGDAAGRIRSELDAAGSRPAKELG
jgi:HEAT repeats/HEAT repeat